VGFSKDLLGIGPTVLGESMDKKPFERQHDVHGATYVFENLDVLLGFHAMFVENHSPDRCCYAPSCFSYQNMGSI
jgi:hypothetical protein